MQGRTEGWGVQGCAEGACNDVQRGRACKDVQREGACAMMTHKKGVRGMHHVASQDDEKALSLA